MKRVSATIIAILMIASAATFAFTTKKQSHSNVTYYWYQADNSQILSGRLNISPVDKPTAMSSLTDCQDESSDVCLVGSSNPNLGFGDDLPSNFNDNYIYKTSE